MKTGHIFVIGAAAVAAYLLFGGKGQGEGGTGGSLDIPAPLLGAFATGGDPYNPANAPAPAPTQISPKIQEAMKIFQVPGGFSVPASANPNPQYGTQYGYGSTGYFTPGTAPGTFFGSDPTGQKQSQADAFYAATAAYNKKASSSSGTPGIASAVAKGDYSSQGGGNYTGNAPVAKKSGGGTVHSYSGGHWS